MTHDKPAVVQRNTCEGWFTSLASTEYEVMERPPFDAGADQDTLAEVVPVEITPRVGAPGTVGRVMDVFAGIDCPLPFTARSETLREEPG